MDPVNHIDFRAQGLQKHIPSLVRHLYDNPSVKSIGATTLGFNEDERFRVTVERVTPEEAAKVLNGVQFTDLTDR